MKKQIHQKQTQRKFLGKSPRFWFVIAVIVVPLVAIWGDLLLNAFGAAGYLKLGFWWF